ncbi:acid protease [Myriangium duriaei CBS 260.36]|uniref:Acid protease n=1 Tax=Myriangium duriaei CBS 260.36 TaxID=1168546 RepID=A0A9P4JAT6_9PEZI|nr:acid protease [Myriangium duriaei CBS 260.36]
MHFSKSLSVVPTLLSLAAASPAGQQGASFSLEQVQSDASTPAQRLAASLGKYSQSDLAKVTAAKKALQAVNITAANFQNVGYILPITIGNQTFHLGVDTGKSDLIVYSIFEPANARENPSHTYYSPGPAAKQLKGLTWNFTETATSSIAGVVYSDKVTLGGVTVTKQAVEAATAVVNWSSVDPFPIDGDIGLGFKKGSSIRPKAKRPATLWENLGPSLKLPLFTTRLLKNKPGTFDFGFIDKTKFQGAISYVNVNADGIKNGAWQFDAGAAAIGSSKHSSTKLGNTLVDSGNYQILIPEAIVTQYFANVSHAVLDPNYGWTVPCKATLPQLHLQVGANTISVGSDKLVLFPVSATSCLSGLQSRESMGLDFNVFGEPFLRKAFVVFDSRKATPRLGFAQQR